MKQVVRFMLLAFLFRSTVTKSECILEVRKLPEFAPLILNKTGKNFAYPDKTAVLKVEASDSILLACPGESNKLSFVDASAALIVCEEGHFTLEKENITFPTERFECLSYPESKVWLDGKCNFNRAKNYAAGFDIGNQYGNLTLINTCFDEFMGNPIYSNYTLVHNIRGGQRRLDEQSFIETEVYSSYSPAEAYQNHQNTLANLLYPEYNTSDVKLEDKYGIEATQLAIKDAFVYRSQQRATFYYINTAPLWHVFKTGNWKDVEASCLSLTTLRNIDLVMYTGTNDIATLPDNETITREIFLGTNQDGRSVMPLPLFIWKVVYEPESNKGVAFVGINKNEASFIIQDFIVCVDVCKQLKWASWDDSSIERGHIYCCEINELRNTIESLPDLSDDVQLLV